ncbi:ciliary microtubule inner protein 2B-like [Planococcus citri]|uniref:ciliary microtubule inner protein 2B-like n=1 Tax=Planococcus citri TaxID=170843 RepID=UPI0031F77952
MFINYSDYEKRDFLAKTQTYFLPGYTGHCPTLKFQIGKCYGTSTKEIIHNLRRNGVIRGCPKIADASYQLPKIDFAQRNKYILGYTGYIPGMYQHYGQSFRQIAEKCETKRNTKAVSFEKKLHPSTDYTKNLYLKPYLKSSAQTGKLVIH